MSRTDCVLELESLRLRSSIYSLFEEEVVAHMCFGGVLGNYPGLRNTTEIVIFAGCKAIANRPI